MLTDIGKQRIQSLLDAEETRIHEENAAKQRELDFQQTRKEKLCGFFKNHLKQRWLNLHGKSSLAVPYDALEEFDPDMAVRLREEPEAVIAELKEGLIDSLQNAPIEPSGEISIQIENLPADMEKSLSSVDYADIRGMFTTLGTITAKTDVKPLMKRGAFKCLSCGSITTLEQTGERIKYPTCEVCKREKKQFEIDAQKSEYTSLQRIEIQEPIEVVHNCNDVKKAVVTLEGKLCDFAAPGEKVHITGMFRIKPNNKQSTEFNAYIEAISAVPVNKDLFQIQVTQEDKERIRKLVKSPAFFKEITESIAPAIYGYTEVKEAVALQMVGGVRKNLPGKTERNKIHILLIGDPSTGKTDLLRYASKITPKGLYTSGKSSSGAGLTATAEKDRLVEGAWTLKAGAMVLASGGLCAVDELDKMNDEDRSALHEALESMTISVSKAGITSTFSAETSLLAAANPKYSRFDSSKPIAEQFDLSPTLLSRFDLIFPFEDIKDKEKDFEIASRILARNENPKAVQPKIDNDTFRKLLVMAEQQTPVLPKRLRERITNFFVEQRQRGEENVIPITPRQLQAIIRLSEASAKIQLKDEVDEDDVDRAIKLITFSLDKIARNEAGVWDSDRVDSRYNNSDRKQIDQITKTVKELEKEWDSVPSQKIYEATYIPWDKLRELLKDMSRKGDINEVHKDHYKLRR